jgi:AraC-like DNA-binding protein
MLLCIAIFAWQGPFYLWRCRRLLLQQWKRQTTANPISCATSSVTWLHLPLVVVFTTWVLGLLRTVHCASHAPQEFATLFSFIDVSVTVGAIYLTVRRASSLELQTFFAAPPQLVQAKIIVTEPPTIAPAITLPTSVCPESSAAKIPCASTGNEIPATISPGAKSTDPVVAEVRDEAKYGRCNLPPRVRQRIKLKLETAFTKEALYRDSLLNLRSLSASIKENTHYVSQVINQDLDSSFYRLVSRYRIEEAKKLLATSPGQTVLEIALSVGFNSKSTFNSAFRQNTGRIPREYRAKHFKEGSEGAK